MTAALQPLLSFKIGGEDAKAVKEAFEAASREDDDDARAAIKKIASPAARNFAEWKRLRNPQADFQEGLAFRLAHPLYPDLPQDGANEKALFLVRRAGRGRAEVLRRTAMPLTGAGHASLGGALLETGERERGLAMIKFAWGRYSARSGRGGEIPLPLRRALERQGPPAPRAAAGRARRLQGRSGERFASARQRLARRAEGQGREGAGTVRIGRCTGTGGGTRRTGMARSRFARPLPAARHSVSAWPRLPSLSATESSAGRAAAGEDKDDEEKKAANTEHAGEGRRQRFQALQGGKGRAGHAAFAAQGAAPRERGRRFMVALALARSQRRRFGRP